MSKSSAQSITIHDVARLSGVSYQTVSRVINNQANVAVPTRLRVQQAIEALDYRPSILAKSLVTRRSQLIGVIAHGMSQYGPSQILQNVQESAHSFGYEIMLTTLQQVKLEEVREQDVLTAALRLRQFGVDGLMLLTNYDAHNIVRGLGRSLPFVLIDAASDVDGPTVSIDQFEGAVMAVRHLVALGHRRILQITGPSGWSDAQLRQGGFAHVTGSEKLSALPVYEGDWSAESGYRATRQALADGEVFTAIFAGNDQMALGVLAALAAAGLRVPEQVSVIGFDDTPESAYYTPPLTTVNQNFALLGRRSMEELKRLIEQPPGEPPHHQVHHRAHHLIFQPQLVLRSTTAPAATQAAGPAH